MECSNFYLIYLNKIILFIKMDHAAKYSYLNQEEDKDDIDYNFFAIKFDD